MPKTVRTEEKQLGVPVKSVGKINWYDEDIAKKEIPEMAFVFQETNPSHQLLTTFKKAAMDHLSKKGFVFYDDTHYRYKLNRLGRLVNFGVRFHHIK